MVVKTFPFIIQFWWRPYTNILGYILADVKGWQAQWLAAASLLCFEIVEWHASDCVTRQFGIEQSIPSDPMRLGDSYNQDLRGKPHLN